MTPLKLVSKNCPDHRLAELASAFASPGLVREFEETFAGFVEAKHAIAFPFCRTGIKAALEVLAPEAETVTMSAYTCLVVPHAVVLAGKRPRFVDIDLKDFNTPPSWMLKGKPDPTTAYLVTQMFGTPVDMSPFETAIARPTLVIEDTALSLQPAFRPRNPNIRSVSIYSFDHNKHLSTIFGGMLVTHDDEAAAKLRAYQASRLVKPSLADRVDFLFRLAAMSVLFDRRLYALFDRVRTNPIVARRFETRASLDAPAFPRQASLTMAGYQAYLGLRQLDKAPEYLERRRYFAEAYALSLRDIPGVTPMAYMPRSHYSHYPVLIQNRDGRQFREKMRARGVEMGRTLDYAMTEIPYYRQFVTEKCPNTERAAREIVNLPNYPLLSDEDFDRIVDGVKAHGSAPRLAGRHDHAA